MNSTETPTHLFLIDDDDDDIVLFGLALEELNIKLKFTSANGASEAFDLLKKSDDKPDYIFLDLNMPLVNGRECLQQLKKDPATSSIPVVIFSTSSEPKDIEDTKALGAIGFITKPPKISQLVNSLADLLTSNLTNK